MRQIKVTMLEPPTHTSYNLAAFGARLTQRGEKLRTIQDCESLYGRTHTAEFINSLAAMPHPTLRKLDAIQLLVFGASRRFLAQITRHQGPKFISASLQYSTYGEYSDFVIPYEVLERDHDETDLNNKAMPNYYSLQFSNSCRSAMLDYAKGYEHGLDNDTCGYMAPHALRNILLISASTFDWQHMIGQRICSRNTAETRYVMLRCWELLYKTYPAMFDTNVVGTFCSIADDVGACKEGRMRCIAPIYCGLPAEIIAREFPLCL